MGQEGGPPRDEREGLRLMLRDECRTLTLSSGEALRIVPHSKHRLCRQTVSSSRDARSARQNESPGHDLACCRLRQVLEDKLKALVVGAC